MIFPLIGCCGHQKNVFDKDFMAQMAGAFGFDLTRLTAHDFSFSKDVGYLEGSPAFCNGKGGGNLFAAQPFFLATAPQGDKNV